MGISLMFGSRRVDRSLPQKIKTLNWLMVLVLIAIISIGVAMLYSVAGGNFDPWATRQMVRFALGMVIMIGIALTDLRFWMSMALPIYGIVLLMLVAVEFFGATGMGGARWLDLGVMRIQPSELMKVALVVALAANFHSLTQHRAVQMKSLLVPIILMALPAYLVLRQPDLGTTLMIIAGGITMLFLAGTRAWLFWTGGAAAIGAIPIVWNFMMDYQKDRVMVFLNPESDPLGAGYQIMQSKIALGSGGLFGKGFMQGTQSHLNFLPEMKTDFIFTVLTEEMGLVGGLVLLGLYLILISYGIWVSLTCRSEFGRLLSMGISVMLFFYVFVNVAMVMGLMPVVGAPLPLVSYGGSALLTVMVGFGFVLSVALHRDLNIPRNDPFG